MPESSSQDLNFSEWLRVFCQESKHPFVRDSEKMIAYCLELDEKIPDRYGWRFSSVEAVTQKVSTLKTLKTPLEVNQIFWTDQARNVEAYAVMTFWRGIELLKPAIRSLNSKEFIAPAVLSRSLMELATAFILNVDVIENTFRNLSFPEGTVVTSEEFEEKIVKAIWGKRLGEPEPHIKQVNILTLIQKISKNPNAKDVLPVYEYLCEIAHPNVVGNTRFWSHIEQLNPDGSELRVLHKYADQETESVTEIMEKILWGLGWSSVCLRNAFEMTSSGIQQLMTKLK